MERANHLGIENICLIFPVIVHKAIAIIIEANNWINTSLKFHNINVEIIIAVIDSQVVDFKLLMN